MDYNDVWLLNWASHINHILDTIFTPLKYHKQAIFTMFLMHFNRSSMSQTISSYDNSITEFYVRFDLISAYLKRCRGCKILCVNDNEEPLDSSIRRPLCIGAIDTQFRESLNFYLRIFSNNFKIESKYMEKRLSNTNASLRTNGKFWYLLKY